MPTSPILRRCQQAHPARAAWLLALLSCSSPGAGSDAGVARCVPGKVEACPCPGAGTSTQTCAADGTWLACACGITGFDGNSPGADGGADGGGGAGGDLSDADAAGLDAASVADAAGDAAASGDALQPGDGVIVSPDIEGDATATESCDPCGHGALQGLVCAPNEQVYVADAKVTLTVTDCDGKIKQVSTVTDKDGRYYFPELPCGKHVAQVTAGKFSATYYVSIKTGKTRDLTGIGQKLCFAANSRKIAVFWGQWDHQHTLLDKLGFAYTFYNFEYEYFNDTNPKDIEAVKLLMDPKALAAYDILFFNCGSAAQKWATGFPEIAKNLKQFVLNGGSLYASDLSWAWIEAAFPDAIDFLGSNDLPSGPSNDGPQQVEGNTQVPATIKDPILAGYVGTTVFTANYGPGPLIAVQGPGSGTTTHVTGVAQIKNLNKKGIFDPETVPHSGPLVLSHQPATPGAGRVVFTTFHNDEQADAVMLKILHYLVFLL